MYIKYSFVVLLALISMNLMGQTLPFTLNVPTKALVVYRSNSHTPQVFELTSQRKYTNEEKRCLTQNIFFESRNQTAVGKVGVGYVVLNRSRDERWPRNLCNVIRDKKHGKQFSWYWDGKPDRPVKSNAEEMIQWEDSKRIAELLTDTELNITDPTSGSMFYISQVAAQHKRIHQFNKLYKYTITLDDHRFYR